MQNIAISTLIVLKSTTLRDYCRSVHSPLTTSDILSWYLLWPGLNARAFFQKPAVKPAPIRLRVWMFAVTKTLLGLCCLTWLAPYIVTNHVIIGGWVALAGLILMIHFGVFHLLALTWQSLGREVRPIMQSPLCATSISDFWSHRWNLAFRDFANLFVMRPMTRRWNGTVAMWGCFAFSGLVHELAISVPARAGYGWPLAYFMLQALGVSCERTSWGQRIGMRDRWTGWLFAFLIIGPPSLLLFHPPFISTVILPLVGISVTHP
ncbi:MAG: hypothetical protein JWM11_3319 [Planctomycetaceae bacterium]|nr:hypothetical protein [Planctomycetaceae bacterium]